MIDVLLEDAVSIGVGIFLVFIFYNMAGGYFNLPTINIWDFIFEKEK